MQKKLRVYKGFDKDFILSHVKEEPLIKNTYEFKTDVFNYDNNYSRLLMSSIMASTEDVYILYEEFVLLQELGPQVLQLSEYKIEIIRNNIFPEYYPISVENPKLLSTLKMMADYIHSSDDESEEDPLVRQIMKFYGDVKIIDGLYFISYKNHERLLEGISIIDWYVCNNCINLQTTEMELDYTFELTKEVESYLSIISAVTINSIEKIGLRIKDRYVIDRYYSKYLNALIINYPTIRFYESKNTTVDRKHRNEFDSLLKQIWGYDTFKELEFYKNPDIDKEVIRISQGSIIEDIVTQCESAYQNRSYRDIFITAPTGAGKSVIFQIAGLYLARTFGKLTIIISPLIALMKDQVENIKKAGVTNVAYINSELNFIE